MCMDIYLYYRCEHVYKKLSTFQRAVHLITVYNSLIFKIMLDVPRRPFVVYGTHT